MLVKTGHPEEGRALSSLALLSSCFMFLMFAEERQSQEATRTAHQRGKCGALALRSLECSRERNLLLSYCFLVSSVSSHTDTSSSFTGKQR